MTNTVTLNTSNKKTNNCGKLKDILRERERKRGRTFLFPSVNFKQSSPRHLGVGVLNLNKVCLDIFSFFGVKNKPKTAFFNIFLFGLKSVKVWGYKRKGMWQNWPSRLFSLWDVVSFGGWSLNKNGLVLDRIEMRWWCWIQKVVRCCAGCFHCGSLLCGSWLMSQFIHRIMSIGYSIVDFFLLLYLPVTALQRSPVCVCVCVCVWEREKFCVFFVSNFIFGLDVQYAHVNVTRIMQCQTKSVWEFVFRSAVQRKALHLSLTLTHTLPLSPSLSQTHTHTHTHTFPLSLSLSHTLSQTHTLSLC